MKDDEVLQYAVNFIGMKETSHQQYPKEIVLLSSDISAYRMEIIITLAALIHLYNKQILLHVQNPSSARRGDHYHS